MGEKETVGLKYQTSAPPFLFVVLYLTEADETGNVYSAAVAAGM